MCSIISLSISFVGFLLRIMQTPVNNAHTHTIASHQREIERVRERVSTFVSMLFSSLDWCFGCLGAGKFQSFILMFGDARSSLHKDYLNCALLLVVVQRMAHRRVMERNKTSSDPKSELNKNK